MPEFRHRSILPYSKEEVFEWHMRPSALERLIPPWTHARVLLKEGEIHDGGRVVLGVRHGPTELKWEITHTDFEEGSHFRDEHVSGPFGEWVHTHRFLPSEDGGCILEDEVEWAPPLGGAGSFITEKLILRELKRFFSFRHARLRHDMDLHEKYGKRGPRTVAISGASGLIGQAMTHLLRSGGHTVIPFTRDGSEGIRWDPENGFLDTSALEGVDGVVNLAGESIFGLRWTAEKKTRIMASRQKGTELLSRGLAGLLDKPRVMVSGSAVGFYGNRGVDLLNEKSRHGKGFLSRVCRAWEDATAPARRANIRVVRLRTGMVLSPAGGALGTMLLPFKMGAGGRLGSGRQYVSWIDLDDLTGLIFHALVTPSVKAALNGTAPHPVPNSTFTNTLGRVLERPTILPVPALAVKGLFGEMGQALLLSSVRAMPEKAEKTGYEFRYPSVEESLRYQLGRPEAVK